MSSALLRAARAGLQRRQLHRAWQRHAVPVLAQRLRTPPAGHARRPGADMLYRCFFWSSNDDDGGGDKGDKKGSGGGGKGDDSHDDGAVHLQPEDPSSSGGGGGGGDNGNGRTTTTTTALAGGGVPVLDRVLALPASERPLFPGLMSHVLVRDPATIAQLKKLGGQPYVGVFLHREPPDEQFLTQVSSVTNVDAPVDVDSLYDVGTFAQIMRAVEDSDDNSVLLQLLGHRRIRKKPGLQQQQQPEGGGGDDDGGDDGSEMLVNVDHLFLKPYDTKSENIIMYTNEILSTLRHITAMNPLFREQVQLLAQNMNLLDPARIADLATTLSTSSREELQDILATLDAETRLQKMLQIVKQEHQRALTQQEMAQEVEKKMAKGQREYFLREQLKLIKQELGIEKDDKDAVRQKFEERLGAEGVSPPEEVMLTIRDELEKFSALEKNSAEYNVTRNYLDWLTCLPWGKHTTDVFDVGSAVKVLDEDHYGMKDVKDRILEFIAVGKLRGQVQGKILCLVGPPGVGKTSIASSIGRCISREFHRFSVGGVSDVSEIKGHRRTYVGAMPGKLIQCLKATGVANPVLLIDEIDKLGQGGMRGDPASALLEVLDPSQNSTFMDHYLDVPVDLSKVLFVCTANTTETIPGPLLDRMEVVRLPGYDLPEKVAIAERYLVPKIQHATGLSGKADADTNGDAEHVEVTLSKEALDQLISGYCREAGVRMLERKIETIYRKVALKVVREDNPARRSVEVQKGDLREYIGQPAFDSQRMYAETPVGVVMGLAWNTMGGSTLYIEAASSGATTSKAGLQVTGNMKEVMRESTQIALTCAKIKLGEWASNVDFLDSHALHLHVPEGATPKDGPSAGATMVTALLSLALNRAVRPDLAMTGEISLTGRILPVGGIREKVIAARREGVKCLVLPKGNQHDFEDLPDYLQAGLEVHFAEHYDDVFDVAFCEDSDLTF